MVLNCRSSLEVAARRSTNVQSSAQIPANHQ